MRMRPRKLVRVHYRAADDEVPKVLQSLRNTSWPPISSSALLRPFRILSLHSLATSTMYIHSRHRILSFGPEPLASVL